MFAVIMETKKLRNMLTHAGQRNMHVYTFKDGLLSDSGVSACKCTNEMLTSHVLFRFQIDILPLKCHLYKLHVGAKPANFLGPLSPLTTCHLNGVSLLV